VQQAAAPVTPPEAPTDVAKPQATSAATLPKLASRLQPAYPAMAQRMRKEATVIVRVLVDESGHVTDTELKGSRAGFGFDEAAIQAARNARFQPATQNGSPIKMWVDLPIQFKGNG
jgi:protein TonB